MGLGSFDKHTANGAQSSVVGQSGAGDTLGTAVSGSLSGHSAVHSSAAADPAITAPFEPASLVAVPDLTDGARSVTRHDTLREQGPSSVDAIPAAPETRAIPRPILATRQSTHYERLVKPLLDRVLALLLLIVCSPILIVVGTMVAFSLGLPIVLRQRRIGRDGKPFVLHKFRTMRPDRRGECAEYDGRDRRVTHKHPDDPRLTSVGRTLRKWSLDELPQLWDVVTGELSLVGPRPELEIIVAGYEPWQHGRHAVKPGLTGLWQITARGEGEMHERTDLDIEYVRHVTFRRDVMIMVRTIPAILARKGY